MMFRTFLNKLIIKYWLVITIVILLLITALSLYPLPKLPEIPGQDKIMHMLAYLVLAIPVSFVKPKNYFFYLVFFVIWSGVIEIIQPYVNRNGELNDLYANIAGILFGSFVGIIFYRMSK